LGGSDVTAGKKGRENVQSRMYVPSQAFLTRGAGKHREKLASFEIALRNAGIASLNLVRVSSIFPPHCKLISKEKGLAQLSPGQLVHVVLSEAAANEPHRLMAAAIGVAIPRDPSKYGYLSEHHSFGENDTKAGEYAEDLAAHMLATILGITTFDADKSYNEEKDIWRLSGQIVKTRNVVQSAISDKNGMWTTVVAAVVLLP
jgi:arginine decarboxylase